MTQSEYSSLKEFYAASDYAKFPQEVRVAGSVPVEVIKAAQTAHNLTDPAVPQFTLQLVLKADIPFCWDLGDGFTDEQRLKGPYLCFTPPDTTIAYDCGGDHELLIACFPSDRIAELLAEEGVSSIAVFNAVHGRALFRDEVLRRATLQMWGEASNSNTGSTLVVDGLFRTIIGRLLQLADAPLTVEQWTLDARVLARLNDVIDAAEDRSLTTAELANTTGMSQFRFARSFKATTGRTPHQYVLARRIARAEYMLAAGNASLAEIAYASGFASQSHMTDVFRQKLGVTPGRYRIEMQA